MNILGEFKLQRLDMNDNGTDGRQEREARYYETIQHQAEKQATVTKHLRTHHKGTQEQ